ncbi:MAG TPA: excinuclease ABC subunit UvrA [Patescibacteria group bacterium]|nr:excinuclease ABC subunit UvrA [Patescibacteria group bacterium]
MTGNQDFISIRGARQHNLKNVDLDLPKNKLVVLTGMSGSGKSSLAFDTIYAEGQRRYVESLSSYARQFLGVMGKPDVDFIGGLSPAISIDQKTTSHNPRSTVGTITEIYDYLRLLYARIGRPHCPTCGREIKRSSIDEIVNAVMEKIEGRSEITSGVRLMILSPVVRDRKGEFTSLFENLKKKGFSRVRVDGTVFEVDEDFLLLKNNKHTISAVIDRLVIDRKMLRDDSERKDFRSRLAADIEISLKLADGLTVVSFVTDASLSFPDKPKNMEDVLYSEKFLCPFDGTSLPEIEPRIFSFNTPHGACETCNGLGSLLKVIPEKLIASSLTLAEGAVIPFERVMSGDSWFSRLVTQVVSEYGGNLRTPWEKLSDTVKNVLLSGDAPKLHRVFGTNRFGNETQIEEKFEGFVSYLERKYTESESEFMRAEIERFMERQICPACNGKRLKPESLAVHVDGLSIAAVCDFPISHAKVWIQNLKKSGLTKGLVTEKENFIAASILKEIQERLEFLDSVGLTYLSLSREAGTLAGGEAQRIRLASQIGTGLTGVLYVLDEPTIGLHPRDNERLIATLHRLRDLGNSVIVVEHDRETIEAADWVVDFGPRAGKNGGEVVAAGKVEDLIKNPASLTGKYLCGKKKVKLPEKREATKIVDGNVDITGARAHNLKSIDVSFPLSKFICITGVSGSGKSTLLHETLYRNLAKELGYIVHEPLGQIDSLQADPALKRISLIDQSPIGKTPRSNPATYTKVFDLIRTVYASTQDAHARGFGAGRFSFNVKGGRCEACQGEGQVKIEMQFLPDVYVTCDICKGTRYNAETLDVLYKEKNIAQVLAMSIDEAVNFFAHHGSIQHKLLTLQDVGLGYMTLGQSAPTLSGGEAQRVKLARELSLRSQEHVMYLLDEPTTGLHFEDIQNLLLVLRRLVDSGNTVVVIEHNLDVIKNADWIIDLGPEGGDAGGEVVTIGTPSEVAGNPESLTGQFLAKELR